MKVVNARCAVLYGISEDPWPTDTLGPPRHNLQKFLINYINERMRYLPQQEQIAQLSNWACGLVV